MRCGPGVEDEQVGPVRADDVLRERLVGGVGGDGREEAAEFVADGVQGLLVAGDADNVDTSGDEGCGDRAAEAVARARDEGGRGRVGHGALRVLVLCGRGQDQRARENPAEAADIDA